MADVNPLRSGGPPFVKTPFVALLRRSSLIAHERRLSDIGGCGPGQGTEDPPTGWGAIGCEGGIARRSERCRDATPRRAWSAGKRRQIEELFGARHHHELDAPVRLLV